MDAIKFPVSSGIKPLFFPQATMVQGLLPPPKAHAAPAVPAHANGAITSLFAPQAAAAVPWPAVAAAAGLSLWPRGAIGPVIPIATAPSSTAAYSPTALAAAAAAFPHLPTSSSTSVLPAAVASAPAAASAGSALAAPQPKPPKRARGRPHGAKTVNWGISKEKARNRFLRVKVSGRLRSALRTMAMMGKNKPKPKGNTKVPRLHITDEEVDFAQTLLTEAGFPGDFLKCTAQYLASSLLLITGGAMPPAHTILPTAESRRAFIYSNLNKAGHATLPPPDAETDGAPSMRSEISESEGDEGYEEGPRSRKRGGPRQTRNSTEGGDARAPQPKPKKQRAATSSSSAKESSSSSASSSTAAAAAAATTAPSISSKRGQQWASVAAAYDERGAYDGDDDIVNVDKDDDDEAHRGDGEDDDDIEDDYGDEYESRDVRGSRFHDSDEDDDDEEEEDDDAAHRRSSVSFRPSSANSSSQSRDSAVSASLGARGGGAFSSTDRDQSAPAASSGAAPSGALKGKDRSSHRPRASFGKQQQTGASSFSSSSSSSAAAGPRAVAAAAAASSASSGEEKSRSTSVHPSSSSFSSSSSSGGGGALDVSVVTAGAYKGGGKKRSRSGAEFAEEPAIIAAALLRTLSGTCGFSVGDMHASSLDDGGGGGPALVPTPARGGRSGAADDDEGANGANALTQNSVFATTEGEGAAAAADGLFGRDAASTGASSFSGGSAAAGTAAASGTETSPNSMLAIQQLGRLMNLPAASADALREEEEEADDDVPSLPGASGGGGPRNLDPPLAMMTMAPLTDFCDSQLDSQVPAELGGSGGDVLGRGRASLVSASSYKLQQLRDSSSLKAASKSVGFAAAASPLIHMSKMETEFPVSQGDAPSSLAAQLDFQAQALDMLLEQPLHPFTKQQLQHAPPAMSQWPARQSLETHGQNNYDTRHDGDSSSALESQTSSSLQALNAAGGGYGEAAADPTSSSSRFAEACEVGGDGSRVLRVPPSRRTLMRSDSSEGAIIGNDGADSTVRAAASSAVGAAAVIQLPVAGDVSSPALVWGSSSRVLSSGSASRIDHHEAANEDATNHAHGTEGNSSSNHSSNSSSSAMASLGSVYNSYAFVGLGAAGGEGGSQPDVLMSQASAGLLISPSRGYQ